MVQNPILRGFHPDPSLLRVGDDYYLATSTFEWAPGVRIYHSTDLKHWDYVTGSQDQFGQDLVRIYSHAHIVKKLTIQEKGVLMSSKITIIGAGSVGSTIAYNLSNNDLASETMCFWLSKLAPTMPVFRKSAIRK